MTTKHTAPHCTAADIFCWITCKSLNDNKLDQVVINWTHATCNQGLLIQKAHTNH